MTNLRLMLVPGSTRAASTNAMALAALHALDQPGLETDLYEGLRELPAFVAYEEPVPAPVADLLARIESADAVVVATPEYAGGLPGAVKNLLDWTVGGGQLYGKPVAWLDVANAGRGGGARSQLRTVLGYVGALIVEDACVHLDVTRRDGVSRLEPSSRARLRAAVRALRAAVFAERAAPPPGESTQPSDWPAHLAPGAVRWARSSRRYEQAVRFYRDLVGLPVLEQFAGSYGEDGTLFGLPDSPVHLEITRAHSGAAGPDAQPWAGAAELVFYLPGPVAVADATRPLREAGLAPDGAPPAYWAANGAVVFRDPDGHGVIYAPWVYARDTEPADRAAG